MLCKEGVTDVLFRFFILQIEGEDSGMATPCLMTAVLGKSASVPLSNNIAWFFRSSTTSTLRAFGGAAHIFYSLAVLD